MNHQIPNAGRDITAHIGALELGAIHAFNDGALEATIQVGPGPSGLTRFPTCMPRIDDGELEATVHAGPSTHLRRSTVCLNIDDQALEASIQAGPSPTMPGYPGCRFRIDDSELEATVQAGPNAQVTLLRNSRRGCEFIDVKDDALEASVISMGPPPAPSMNLQCLTRVSCGRIDDGALEAAVHAGPSTMPPACRFRIDDSVIEAAVQAGPQRPTAIRLPGGGCLPGIDDSALEATVQAGPSTMPPACRFRIDA